MTEFIVDDDIAERVQALARREQRSVSAVLRTMLNQYTLLEKSQPTGNNWLREMAEMADAETGDVWKDFSPDLSENSRRILREEFADDLRKRMNNDIDSR